MIVVNTPLKNLQKKFTDGGIDHEFIAPYTPHHNGIVERRN